jgi:hypothetical protein
MEITEVEPSGTFAGDTPARVLASTSIPASEITDRLVTGVFSNPAAVVAGQKYALVLKSDSPLFTYRIDSSVNSYAGIDAWVLQKSGSDPWVGSGGLDLIFATYVTPPPDTTAPTTTAALSTQPNEAGWNNSDVTVRLSADDQGGSGVEKITYSASGAQTIEQDESFGSSVELKLEKEGTTTLTYFATDEAGNEEAPHTLTVKIDKTAPSVSSTNPSSNATGVSATANISATFAETGSGIDPGSIYNAFQLVQVKPTGNVAVSGIIVGYDEDSNKATFVPTGSLAKGLYKAIITTSVEDKAGNALSEGHTWLFTTVGPSKR